MNPKPIIGISASLDDKRFYLNRAYSDAIIAAGGQPIIITQPESLHLIDGLLLSGGGDIAGQFFGQPTHPLANDIWPQRDEAEINMAQMAYAQNMPIFGICRGLQVLNVALGGDIIQHIDGHKQDEPRNVPTHSVIMNGTKIMVNSIHHQAVGKVAPPLQVCATADDGAIEALHDPRKPFVLGVQWHPEELIHMPEHFALFASFVAMIMSSRA